MRSATTAGLPVAQSQAHARRPFQLLAAGLALAIFVLDTFSTLRIAIAVLYGLVVLTAVSFTDRRGITCIAVGCAGLTVASYLIEHAGEEPGSPLLRCFVSLAALVVTTLLVLRNQAAAEAIARSERRYRTIFQSTAAAIWEEDYSRAEAALRATGRNAAGLEDCLMNDPQEVLRLVALVQTLDVNTAALRLVGAENKGQLLTSLPQIFGPESLPMLRGLLLALIGEDDVYESETEIRTFGGERRSVLMAATFAPPPYRSERVFVSVVDITERSRAEQALAQTRAELAHVSRVTTLGELTASIAHEVNQPLAAVVTNAEACLRWLNRPVPDLAEARECVGEVVTQGRRAGDVVQRLRTLSRKGEPQRQSTDVNAVMKEAVRLVARELADHDVSVRLELGGDLDPVSADRIQLQQVLINLMINALQAMGAAASRELCLITKRHEDGVRISVSDCGTGVDEQSLRRLFTPFYTTKPQGMGMGLSICRSIVEAHGGRIWAECNAGPGLTFHLALSSAKRDAA